MAFFDTTWYVNSVGYTAVALRPRNTAVTVGMIRRPATAPALNSERVYVCTFAGTTADVADATWTFTHAAVVIDGTCSWMECTGTSAMNGDLANTPTWAKIKTGTTSVGVIIKRANGASYQVITTNGTVGAAEPAFSDTPGATTADGTATWTCLGPVGNFLGGKAPHARLSNAFTTNWADSGDTIYIGHNHSEVQSTNMTIGANNGTLITKTLCHNAAGSYPPATGDLTTGALVATDQGGTIQVPASAGSYYFYGITFRAGSIAMPNAAVLQLGSNSSATTQLSNWYSFESCLFQIGGSGDRKSVV